MNISPVVYAPTHTGDFTGQSVSIVVDPFDSSTVWLGTGYEGLFMSVDCGSTWKHVNTGNNGSLVDQSVLWSMMVDPVNQGVIYAAGTYGSTSGVLKSSDGGVNWIQTILTGSTFYNVLPLNDFVGNVSMDPTNPLHLIAASHGGCSSPFTSGCIGETFDGGNTWPNIQQMPGGWAEKGGAEVLNATTWIWGTGDAQDGLWVTTNNGKNWTQALPGGMGDGWEEFTTIPRAPASDGAYYVPAFQGLLRSLNGTDWSLVWGATNNQTPQLTAIALSPTTIYGTGGGDGQPYYFYKSAISNYKSYSTMNGPAFPDASMVSTGYLSYDAAYHVVYGSFWSAGVYRYVTTD
jgi:hypothetical protein